MKIKIITGSHRADSASKAVGKHLAEKLNKQGVDASVTCLFDNDFPLWNVDKYSDTEKWAGWNEFSKELAECEGIIFVAPEYNGMVPAIMNNLFLLTDKGELAHKAGLIVGVSASINGVYPVSELRSYSLKNTKINYIPDHLIIRDVNDFLENGNDYMNDRIDYTLNVFKEYTKALTTVRNSGVTATDKYAYGQ
tara:strand:+ start:2383 stop:2964 length:582 start_codon:yes stop_codon:yes gene_type:complete